MMTLILALRGAAAVGILLVLVGGVPRVVQIGLSVVVGLWSALLIEVAPPAEGAVLLIAARELVIGATLGLVAVMPLLAAGMAGRLVDVASGSRGPYRTLFGVLAAAVFVGIDGHVMVVTSIAESFRTVPAIAEVQPRVLDAIGGLIAAAVRLSVPWLATVAVVEIAVGAGTRLAARAAVHAPVSTAVPAALAMMTAAFLSTLAVAMAALVRGTL